MPVKVTFYEHVVPGHWRGREGMVHPPNEFIRVPDNVSFLDILGAQYDPDIGAWRVLTRRYEDVRER